MKRNKKTKPVQSARKKLFDSDAYTDILDAALTSAEEELKAFLPTLKPSEVSEAFATHIHTHLSTELSNIVEHGHRNDDPEDIPPTNQDLDNWRVEEGRYVVSSDDVLIADCYADSAMDFGLPEPSEYQANARLIAKSPQMATLVNLVARMKTEKEFGDNAPPSEDWVSTLNDLIVEARKIVKLKDPHSGRKEDEMKRNIVVAAYVLEIVGDLEPKLRDPYKNSDTRDRAAKRLRTKDEEYENGIFALDLVKNGKVHVWAYSAGFLDTAYEARDEDQAEKIDAPSEPLKSIDRPGPRKDAQNALRKFGA